MQPGRRFLILFTLFCTILSSCEKPEDKALAMLERENFSLTPVDFVRAAAMGDDTAVQNFLTAGMDIDARNPDGENALIAATTRGHLRMVELLIAEGASVDVRDKDGRTPLMTASFNNHPEIVKALIANAADASKKDNSGWTALMQAVYNGHTEVVEQLAPISTEGTDRALLVAALMGHEDVMVILLENKADVNAVTESGETALMLAAQKGRMSAVQLLLGKGADKTLKNNVGETAESMATERGHAEVAAIITNSPVVALAQPDTTPAQPAPTDPAPTTPAAELAAAAAALPEPALPVESAPEPALTEEIVPSVATNPAAMGEVVAVAPPSAPATAGEETTDTTVDSGGSPEEAWFKKHGLDLSDPAMLDQDADSDGFSNSEEFLADTDPNEAASRPPLVTRLQMTEYFQDELPLILESVDGSSARLRRSDTGTTITVGKGDKISGLPYTVVQVRSRVISSKEAQRADVSEATLKDSRTGESILLVRGMKAKSSNTGAVLQLTGTGESVKVKLNESFTVPGEPAINYTVIDIRPTQTIVRNPESSATFTVPKAAK